MGGRYLTLSSLPDTLGIFPLSGSLLLPRGALPLNVFEPRYLALVDAAIAGSRLIGMIQPIENEEKVLKPALSAIGCAGRIISYQETDDGRYVITLKGICRFGITQESETIEPFRIVRPDFSRYARDLIAPDESKFPRERLLAALKDYLSRRDMKADWKSVMSAPAETLVNALSMMCPFEPSEKQAILEAPDWDSRVDTLVALLEMAPDSGGAPTIN